MSNNIKFYELDINYIRYLHNIDSEVYFDENNNRYMEKPYIGILVIFEEYKYFIPLTSRKRKHINFKNSTQYHLIVFEKILRKELVEGDYYKLSKVSNDGNQDNDEVNKILSLVNFKKAIPVPNGYFSEINFSINKNRNLLIKEYNFCNSKKDIIFNRAKKLIKQQHETHKTLYAQCNYESLEKAWLNSDKELNYLSTVS